MTDLKAAYERSVSVQPSHVHRIEAVRTFLDTMEAQGWVLVPMEATDEIAVTLGEALMKNHPEISHLGEFVLKQAWYDAISSRPTLEGEDEAGTPQQPYHRDECDCGLSRQDAKECRAGDCPFAQQGEGEQRNPAKLPPRWQTPEKHTFEPLQGGELVNRADIERFHVVEIPPDAGRTHAVYSNLDGVLISKSDCERIAAALSSQAEERTQALEDACKAVCEGCEKGWPLNNYNPDHVNQFHQTPEDEGFSRDVIRFCEASPIRALIQEGE